MAKACEKDEMGNNPLMKAAVERSDVEGRQLLHEVEGKGQSCRSSWQSNGSMSFWPNSCWRYCKPIRCHLFQWPVPLRFAFDRMGQ